MNRYSRSFQTARGRRSAWVQARAAFLGAALGFALHWSLSWHPAPAKLVQPLAFALDTLPSRQEALRGRRISVLGTGSDTATGPGDIATGARAGLRALLAASGAVAEPSVPGDIRRPASPAPDLILEVAALEPEPGAFRGPRCHYEQGDSLGARACMYLSLGASADLGVPLGRPIEEAASAARRPAGAPWVRVELPRWTAASAGPDSARPELRAVVRSLSCYFASLSKPAPHGSPSP